MPKVAEPSPGRHEYTGNSRPQSQERQWPGVSPFQSTGHFENFMTSHSIDADIKVKWPEGQSAYSPGTAEELPLIALDLLVKEMGSDAARSFVDQVFERYRHEPSAAHA